MSKAIDKLTKQIAKLEKTVAGYFGAGKSRSKKSGKRKSAKAVVKRIVKKAKKTTRRKAA